MRIPSWVGKIPWRRAWLPTPVFLPGESMDRGALWATVQGVAKSQTRLKRLSRTRVHPTCGADLQNSTMKVRVQE